MEVSGQSLGSRHHISLMKQAEGRGPQPRIQPYRQVPQHKTGQLRASATAPSCPQPRALPGCPPPTPAEDSCGSQARRQGLSLPHLRLRSDSLPELQSGRSQLQCTYQVLDSQPAAVAEQRWKEVAGKRRSGEGAERREVTRPPFVPTQQCQACWAKPCTVPLGALPATAGARGTA